MLAQPYWLIAYKKMDVGGGVPDAPCNFRRVAKFPGGYGIRPYANPKFRPRRGQCGGRRKSVKKNAALLHFLAFSLADHPFGVPRGEQPLGRGPLPRNSGTFFASFFGHKKGRPNGCNPLY